MTKRLAISVQSEDGLSSILDPRFGRAFAYLVVDVDTTTVIAELENKSRQDTHGAGTGAAAMLANSNVDAVISGRFGPKAAQALDNLGIEMWIAPDGITAGEAVSRFLAGNLQQEAKIAGSTVSGGQAGLGRGRGTGGKVGGGKGRGQGRGKGCGGQGRGQRGQGGGGQGRGRRPGGQGR